MLKSPKLLSKTNVYSRLLILVILMLVIAILATESTFLLGNELDGPNYGGFAFSIIYVIFISYFILLLNLLDYSKRIQNGFIVYAIIGFIGSFYFANPFLHVLSDEKKPLVYIFFHLCNFCCEIFFSAAVLRDIFSSEKTHSDHIWGAIVIYFLLVICFSEIYEIITLIQPGLLGKTYVIGYPNFVECVMFSLNSVAGVDTLFPDAHSLLRKLGNLENVFGNLFLVVILGRLLSRPIEKINAVVK